MSNGAMIAAAIIARKRREIFNAFRAAGATSSLSAKSLSEIGVKESGLFKIQLMRGTIVQLPDRKYFFDEIKAEEVAQTRRALALSLGIAFVVIGLILLLLR